ncbi:hypothetical protein AB0M34_11135 [Nocardia sp. NPDC050193]
MLSRAGRFDHAREHLQRARDTIGADQYGQLIRSGLEHPAQQPAAE